MKIRRFSRTLSGLLPLGFYGALMLVAVTASREPNIGPLWGLSNSAVLHVGACALLAPLLAHAGSLWYPRSLAKRLIAAMILVTLLGGGVELLHALLPYRSAQWGDWVLDVVGGGLGTALVLVSAAVRRLVWLKPA